MNAIADADEPRSTVKAFERRREAPLKRAEQQALTFNPLTRLRLLGSLFYRGQMICTRLPSWWLCVDELDGSQSCHDRSLLTRVCACVRVWEVQELEEGRSVATATTVFAEILGSVLMLIASQNSLYFQPTTLPTSKRRGGKVEVLSTNPRMRMINMSIRGNKRTDCISNLRRTNGGKKKNRSQQKLTLVRKQFNH